MPRRGGRGRRAVREARQFLLRLALLLWRAIARELRQFRLLWADWKHAHWLRYSALREAASQERAQAGLRSLSAPP